MSLQPSAIDLGYPHLLTEWAIPNQRWGSYSADDLVRFISNPVFLRSISHQLNITPTVSGNASLEHVRDALVEYYVRRPEKGNVTAPSYLQRYVRLLSDLQFVMPQLREVEERSVAGWPIYVYEFAHVNKSSLAHLPYEMVPHVAVYRYFFTQTVLYGQVALSREDEVVSRRLVDTYVRFIREGRPSALAETGGGNAWPRVNSRMGVVEFGTEGNRVTDSTEALESRRLWESLGMKL